ncbi:hypothetical protein ElyMa_006557700 [Elysia marginata]|uniref:Uncharacterized protein n=1 Tax=Elysia marginata TaxID=1093978 RepID=A0AAV4IBH4_9GAST|nr:hypothetical protein ElyMa_006557700 [Elysia marginata]
MVKLEGWCEEKEYDKRLNEEKLESGNDVDADETAAADDGDDDHHNDDDWVVMVFMVMMMMIMMTMID